MNIINNMNIHEMSRLLQFRFTHIIRVALHSRRFNLHFICLPCAFHIFSYMNMTDYSFQGLSAFLLCMPYVVRYNYNTNQATFSIYLHLLKVRILDHPAFFFRYMANERHQRSRLCWPAF